jgi:hypothetical protein
MRCVHSFRCSLCPNIKPWPTYHKAERHRTTHIPLAFRKMFQCPQCKERFIKEKNVKRHLDSGLCQAKGFRIRLIQIQIRIQHFRLNKDPDPAF